ncbi:hypothetical protein CcaverHIS002_0100550 [Cutaneotrichosporon cavernicola]|uniref:BZIP domain-containing protein n=1 Tax=Cutaneotrichosporon cavernicola TaxID=279322 RepID=A0AA48KWN4_9TREE|nr:uncharacterized protein CcaverHIS019_0100520 [Cutaneotrichosporon cavernicola]BEI79526.1 hypothetical protein CcaverHIS002_0100550 [Cutaneotrichosporon cavernicola]BEI87334.1 hypothetical protein CcaverHIS019_0100520 [Cutaneotrichosporon cavernicola]BEI95104.1 hypothetical protein CcaverHIS631_0100530 [Cutaneotrichosporon cavernicola]BEJ02878.1 hypothetical protein CcaverHIS641_0100530 [Cutaneotrichosporon cavernicola]
MYSDLPPHLQSLNLLPSTSSPPSSGLSGDTDDLWDFLNADVFSSGFGTAPAAWESKVDKSTEAVAATPADEKPAVESKETPAATTAPTLESFLAAFANETIPAIPPSFVFSLPSALTPSAPSNTAAPTPAPGADDDDEEPERVTGAKRLKQLGASPAEVEEDKRRRNTEASARFRAKKKERERALDDRAKQLEQQVATLTAEKASLEKENNLLKFVLVNTHGVAPGGDGLQAAVAALGKRKQDQRD